MTRSGAALDDNDPRATRPEQPREVTSEPHRGRRRRTEPEMSIDSLWERQHIRDEQAKDDAISSILPFIQSGEEPSDLRNSHDKELQCYIKQRQSLIVKEGILYRTFVNNDGSTSHYQLVLPRGLRESFLKFVHDITLCHLKSQMKMEAEIMRHAFWPCWKAQVRIFLAKCLACLQFHAGKLPKHGYLRDNDGSLGAPGQRLSIDLIGPLPNSKTFRFAIMMCDMFSRFVYIQALREESASAVAAALVKFSITHGWYGTIKHDLGREFENQVSEQLYLLTGIQRHTSFSYMPRQMLIERSHKVINSMIGKTVSSHREWAEYIDCIAFAYNSSVHKGTNFSPNFLHFGRNIPTSLDVLMANPEVEGYHNYGEFAEKTAQRMQYAFNVACDVSLKLPEASKKYYDARVRPKLLEEGDKVLAFCPQRRLNVFAKWAKPFSVQAEVLRRVNDVTYLINILRTGKTRIFHIDKLKLLQRGESETSELAASEMANG
jgi:hypothetical protein